MLVLGTVLGIAVGCSQSPGTGGGLAGSGRPPVVGGMDYCANCHSAPLAADVPAAQKVFGEWLVSAHGNFQSAAGTVVDPATLMDETGHAYAWSEVIGDPSFVEHAPGSSCDPCHSGASADGTLLAGNSDGLLFSNPDLGRVARPAIGCESCHGAGGDHFAPGYPPETPLPGFAQCSGTCHSTRDDDESDHHGLWTTRSWLNAAGERPRWRSSIPALIETVDQWGLTVVMVNPNVAAGLTSAPAASYQGPYYFTGERTINDTHFGEAWITDEPDKVTFFVAPRDATGAYNGWFPYVDLLVKAPNNGVVDSRSPRACTASCHQAHSFDQEINRQWANGAHHPRLGGPVLAYLDNYSADALTPEDAVTSPSNWHAVDHDDFRRPSCTRCHSAPGFAEEAPGYSATTDYIAKKTYPSGGSFITCNACHDGEGYPTLANKRLRFTGSIGIFGQVVQSPSTLKLLNTIPDAGNSAVCVYCHEGRGGSETLIKWDNANAQRRFRNRHDAVAVATAYPGNGELTYEFAGKAYTRNFAHEMAGCVGCHMAPAGNPAASEEVGGHTFMVAEGNTQNLSACTICHPGATDMRTIISATAHNGDWDSNAATIYPADEFAFLYTTLKREIYVFPNGTLDGAWVLEGEGGRLGVTDNWVLGVNPAGDDAIRIAAFNFQTLRMDPGGWAHNIRYSIQIMRDTINGLRFASGRPAYGGTRP